MSAEVRLTTPRLDQAGAVMEARVTLFMEEFVSVGVEPAVALRHVESWPYQDPAEYGKAMQPLIENPGCMYEVAEHDGMVRGLFLGVRAGARIARIDRDVRENELWMIALHQSLRGVPEQPVEARASHRWMSRFLFEFGDRSAPTSLEVLQGNARAIRFYQKWGFVVVGTDDMFVGGQLAPSYLMERPPQEEVEGRNRR